MAHRLVEEMVERGPGREFRWMLHTADAHALYGDFGFAPPNASYLERPAPPERARLVWGDVMTERLTARVFVAGGGPAGVMLGLLLARAGIDVVVLEKHTDFFRDFRGDTVHPSTLDLVDQLGFRDAFEAVPHTRLRTLDVVVGSMRLHPIDFGRLRGRNHEIALMPQWDLLTLLASEGRRYPGFRLVMGAEVTDVVRPRAA